MLCSWFNRDDVFHFMHNLYFPVVHMLVQNVQILSFSVMCVFVADIYVYNIILSHNVLKENDMFQSVSCKWV